ncbi:MAG: hypothetical protein WCX97_00315 [Candidatus Magasanikbacteria bacterium]
MLSPKAQKLMNEYLSLPFSGVGSVRCPYFVNTRVEKRGQIRSLVGKGTPKEIVEEAKIISIQYHRGVFDHAGRYCINCEHIEDKKEDANNIRKFLIDSHLGIDCSGLVTHILRTHYLETQNIDITNKLISHIPANLLRKMIMRLRPVESIGVKSGYSKDASTQKLGDEIAGYDYSNIQAGDIIIMLETGPNKKRNHMLLITNCDHRTIQYVHARAWSGEGQYGHGVNTGEIQILTPDKGLLAQEWIEKSPALSDDLFHQSNTNETFLEAKNASVLEIRRVKV